MTTAATKSSTQLYSIRKYGDPILRRRALPVTEFNDQLAKTIAAMFYTMYDEPGIGLAAPQVGLSLRLMVVDVQPDGNHNPMVLINPKLEEAKGRILSEEGCLSFPGINVKIPRAAVVRFSALNEKGMPILVTADGLLSRCLQHELDHLDGKLMIDHVPLPQRWAVYWEIRKRKKARLW